MKVLDPGHHYKLDAYDGEAPVELRFMKRVGEGYPGNQAPAYAGTNCQEVLRVLIDRVKYLDAQIPHEANSYILYALRESIAAFEYRAAQRHGRKFFARCLAEDEPVCRRCGHIRCDHSTGANHDQG